MFVFDQVVYAEESTSLLGIAHSMFVDMLS